MPIILVVDDSETDRKLIGGLLKCKLDWIVQYASDGAEAFELVGQVFPDVVITDLQMPVMNGIELCAQVKREHPHVPVLLTTGVGSESLAVAMFPKTDWQIRWLKRLSRSWPFRGVNASKHACSLNRWSRAIVLNSTMIQV